MIPPAQERTGFTPNLLITPAATTGITLQAHIAEFRISDAVDGASRANVVSTYRLHNPGNSLEALTLRLSPVDPSSAVAPGTFRNLAMTAGEQSLPLEPDGRGGYTTQVQLDADARLTLLMTYEIDLDGILPTVYYAPSVLNRWPGNVSLRIDVLVPDSIVPESWTRVEPDTWTYGLPDEPALSDLKWLYDSSVPEQPFLFQFVLPSVWAEISAGEEATVGVASLSGSGRLGDLYRRLHEAPEANAAVRDRFYAQSLAAYLAGLSSATAASSAQAELAPLHIGLANLYRNQIVDEASGSVAQYAEAMVQEVIEALSLIPADDSRRRELAQWQADGLHVMLNDARNRRDWQRALGTLKRMAQLPPDVIDGSEIENGRREITIQQALQLLEQGNREAAFAVAGPEIASPDLSPPEQSHAIFSGWQVTVTANPQTIDVIAVGVPVPGREESAMQSAQELIDLWRLGIDEQAYAFSVGEVMMDGDGGAPAVRIDLRIPVVGGALALANLVPSRPDWALLRSLLLQLSPSVERRSALLWHTLELSQPLDLRSAGDQWNAIAANLERQADQANVQAEADATPELTSAETALQARIKAVQYRTVAEEWRDLSAQQLALVFVCSGWRTVSGWWRCWRDTILVCYSILSSTGVAF